MVGILGGYGDIGRNVTAFLEKYSDVKIRIGSRHPERKLSGEHSDRISYGYVDITDIESVRQFVKGCDAVVNCTGCNDDNVVAAADAISAAECGYVDLCMNEKLKNTGKGKVVYGCGSIPGLAELMMLYLGRTFVQPEDMTFIYGALGSFSLTAAQDYLEGVLKSSNRSMVCWKNGSVTECDSFTELEQRFPFTDEKCMMFPYMDEGAVYAASELGLSSGSWYMAFAGKRTLQALENSSAVYTKDRNRAIQALSTASQLDCAEKGKFAGILIEVKGIINKEGDKDTRTLYLRCDDPSRLTGAVAAAALLALGTDILPEGAYPLYKCGQPGKFIKYLEEFRDVFGFYIADGDRSVFMEDIEGEI